MIVEVVVVVVAIVAIIIIIRVKTVWWKSGRLMQNKMPSEELMSKLTLINDSLLGHSRHTKYPTYRQT